MTTLKTTTPFKCLYLVIFVFFLTSCTEPVKTYTLEFPTVQDALNSESEMHQIDICSLVPIDWDSIVVLKPYITEDQFNALKLENLSAVRKEAMNVSFQDWNTSFLFVKANQIVGYSVVPIRPIDFGSLKSNDLVGAAVIQRSQCAAVLLRKKQVNDDVYYEPDLTGI